MKYEIERRLLDYPDMHQKHNSDCGSEALHSVLLYYGIEIENVSIKRDQVEKMVGTTDDGTSIEDILRVLDKFGLEYTSKQMNLGELIKYINEDIPIIMPLQAWAKPEEKTKIDYTNLWEHGHYVVAIGYKKYINLGEKRNVTDRNKSYIIFGDPYEPKRTKLSFNELIKSRWHDEGINKEKYIQHGIAVYGKDIQFNHKNIIDMR